jgi:hypothetical protein
MEHLAQSLQGAAHGRLAQKQTCGSAADVPLFRDDRKYDKKVEVCLTQLC